MAPDDNHPDDLSEEMPPREVTLSTSTILGLFFALALVCAAFFGFGYSVGRKSVPAPAAVGPTSMAEGYKPPAGSPAIQAVPGYMSQQEAAEANKAGSDNQVLAPASASAPVSAKAPAATQQAPAGGNSAPAATIVRETAAAAPAPAPVAAAATAAGNSYVQIAAVSRQDDADLLLKALRSRGYAVSALPGADKLIHVQMGPFSTRKDADAMRQRLLADGYNAILK